MSGINCPKCGQALTYLNGVVVCPRCDASQRDPDPALAPSPLSPSRTANEFDPYHEWLGIPKTEQPANHYRLLGVPLFETNADVISNASDRQMSFVRSCALGPRSHFSQQLLNQISEATSCLLTPDTKTLYDQKLARTSASANGAPSLEPGDAAGRRSKTTAGRSRNGMSSGMPGRWTAASPSRSGMSSGMPGRGTFTPSIESSGGPEGRQTCPPSAPKSIGSGS